MKLRNNAGRMLTLLSISAALVLCGGQAQASGTKLLECQISSGDFQEILVVQTASDTVVLKTLDSSGGAHSYALAAHEWPSKTLNIPCPREAVKSCGNVYVDAGSGEWMYDLGQSGYQNIGYCR